MNAGGNPRPLAGGTGAGERQAGTLAQPDFRSLYNAGKDIFLHVAGDGTEAWFEERPGHLPVTPIAIVRDEAGALVQQTWTRPPSHRFDDPFYDLEYRPPRGKGWELHRIENRNFAAWRRPVRGGVV